MKNGQMWFDDAGKPIQAHGGMILPHAGRFYWYGENKDTDTKPSPVIGSKVDFVGISCYSSENLHDWKEEGLALTACGEVGSALHAGRVCERPRVLYHEKNRQFVMWLHLDDAHYCAARAGVAVAKDPAGPFTLMRTMQPNHCDSRDLTVFQDGTQEACLIHSSDWNKTMRIARLNEAFDDVTGEYRDIFQEQEREAPCIIREKDSYYILTSGCTGWEPNAALYGVGSRLYGRFRLMDNPCEGKERRSCFAGQASCLFRDGGRIWCLLDHWKKEDLRNSGYSILPVTIREERMEICWTDEF